MIHIVLCDIKAIGCPVSLCIKFVSDVAFQLYKMYYLNLKHLLSLGFVCGSYENIRYFNKTKVITNKQTVLRLNNT